MRISSFLCIWILFSTFTLKADESRFVVVTPEKTGTHLLTKAIERLTGKGTKNNWQHVLSEEALLQELQTADNEACFLQIHALPVPQFIQVLKREGYKVVFLMRDPRDVLVSLYYHIEKGWAYGPCRLDFPYAQLCEADKLDELITGRRFGLSTPKDIIGRRIPWLNQDFDFVYTVHFENLVGGEGGGSDEAQLKEISQIANHLGLEKTFDELVAVTDGLFGMPGEKTFRKGKIGAWKTHFTPMHIASFKKSFGVELVWLGYEKNNSW